MNDLIYKSFIEDSPGYIFWKNTDFEYVGCNMNLCRAQNLNGPEDILGKTDYDFIWGKESADKFKADDLYVIKTENTHISEYKVPIPDDQYLWIKTEKKPWYDENRNVIGLIGVAVDITLYKQYQAIKVEVENTAQSMRLYKTIASSFSHEIKTPLSNIFAQVELLDRLLIELRDLDICHTLEKATNFTVENLMRIPENIKLSAQKSLIQIDMMLMNLKGFKKASLTRLDIKKCIADFLAQYPFSREERTYIDCNIDNSFALIGNKTLLKHVFFCLISNALYFLKETHGFRAPKIEISATRDRNWNIINFKDNATGIKEESLPLIFNEFFTESKENGTGIGLAICKEIINYLNGSIECYSEYGSYTKFIMKFPCVD